MQPVSHSHPVFHPDRRLVCRLQHSRCRAQKPSTAGFSPDADGQPSLSRLHQRLGDDPKSRPGLSCSRPSRPSQFEPGVPITPEQEADLRAWLYDFLVAFSVSGNDSLAATFYLRGGVR